MIDSKTEQALGSANETTDVVRPPSRVARKRPKPAPAVSSPSKRPQLPHFRRGTKAGKILQLLRRPQGASLAELTKATKWQAHSVRGFLSVMKGKMRLKISSTKRDDGQRAYYISAR